jgi:RHS repeat-associated protein
MPVASIDATTGAVRWYGTDHLGTPFLQTDAAGSVFWRAEYTPYGDVFTIRSGASLHQPLRLPGQVAQDGSNLYNNVFRWYRSGWGRYTQADPLGLLGGDNNIYSYTRNNPANDVDSLGLSPGDKYQTRREAGIQAIHDISDRSICENREYAGYLYQNADGTYSYNTPQRGSPFESDPALSVPIPGDARIVGSYHTHAAYDPGLGLENELFSLRDKVADDSLAAPGYLGTPSGAIRVYFPDSSKRQHGHEIKLERGTGGHQKPCDCSQSH